MKKSLILVTLLFSIFLFPISTYAYIILPSVGELIQIAIKFAAVWTIIIFTITGISVVLKKPMPLFRVMQLNSIPLILLILYAIYGTFTISTITLIVPFIPFLIVTFFQAIIAYFLLKKVFYTKNSILVKIIYIIGITGLFLFLYPKMLYTMYYTYPVPVNINPQKCVCIGIQIGEPEQTGYYCSGIPVMCQKGKM